MKNLVDNTKNVIAKAGNWLVERPPTQSLTEQEIQLASTHISALCSKGYGCFPVTDIAEDRQDLFSEYFFREGQKALVKSKFRFILIRVRWDFARRSNQISFPIAKALFDSLKDKKTIVEEMGKEWGKLKEKVEKKENQFTVTDEDGDLERLVAEHGKSKETRAEIGAEIGTPGAKINGKIGRSGEEHNNQEDMREKHHTHIVEKKPNPPDEQVILNAVKSFLAELSNRSMTFYYDWLEEVRREVTDKDTLDEKVKLDPRSFLPADGCLGCLLAPITWTVAGFMKIMDWFAPKLRKQIRKTPTWKGNPFGVNCVRPLFILEGVSGAQFSVNEDAINILHSMLNSPHAIFLVFTDAQIEKKLK